MRSKAIIFCLVLILFSFSQTQAKIIHVPGDSSTIQGGINGTVNGDTVLVAPDTYYEHINFNGKAILVKSEAGAENTTIAKAYDGISIVTFATGEDTTSVLDGFTITGGKLVEMGAGINCDSASPKIRNNIITNNSATDIGGGFCCHTGHPILESNTLMNNTGDEGGAIYLCDCDAHIRGNFIKENFSGEHGGGGLNLYECNETTVEKNLIILNNAVGLGGGILLQYSTNNLLVNNTFSENGAYSGGGISLWGAQYNTLLNNIIVSSSSGYGITSNLMTRYNLIEFNDFWNNSPGEYYLTFDHVDNCISADPLFCDPENDNYDLCIISPCLGTGQNGSDIGAFGMGCLLVGDANQDGEIEVGDIVYLISYLFKNGLPPQPLLAGDATSDGEVDIDDMVYLISYLFRNGPPPECC